MKLTNLSPKSVTEIFESIDHIFNHNLSLNSYNDIMKFLNPDAKKLFSFYLDKYLNNDSFHTEFLKQRREELYRNAEEELFDEEEFRFNLKNLKDKNSKVFYITKNTNNRDYRFNQPFHSKLLLFYVNDKYLDAKVKNQESNNRRHKIINDFKLKFIQTMKNHMSNDNAKLFFSNSFASDDSFNSFTFFGVNLLNIVVDNFKKMNEDMVDIIKDYNDSIKPLYSFILNNPKRFVHLERNENFHNFVLKSLSYNKISFVKIMFNTFPQVREKIFESWINENEKLDSVKLSKKESEDRLKKILQRKTKPKLKITRADEMSELLKKYSKNHLRRFS